MHGAAEAAQRLVICPPHDLPRPWPVAQPMPMYPYFNAYFNAMSPRVQGLAQQAAVLAPMVPEQATGRGQAGVDGGRQQAGGAEADGRQGAHDNTVKIYVTCRFRS